tara:strand:+ start:222 stop:323 length:102 start_codon:yes stop_codon:yes gene_type:complete
MGSVGICRLRIVLPVRPLPSGQLTLRSACNIVA